MGDRGTQPDNAVEVTAVAVVLESSIGTPATAAGATTAATMTSLALRDEATFGVNAQSLGIFALTIC